MDEEGTKGLAQRPALRCPHLIWTGRLLCWSATLAAPALHIHRSLSVFTIAGFQVKRLASIHGGAPSSSRFIRLKPGAQSSGGAIKLPETPSAVVMSRLALQYVKPGAGPHAAGTHPQLAVQRRLLLLLQRLLAVQHGGTRRH
nr:hypothetical protein Itr_chr05CG20200 [Ipomoea trifida]